MENNNKETTNNNTNETKEKEAPKQIPAPIPDVNVWKVEKSSSKIPVTKETSGKKKSFSIIVVMTRRVAYCILL
jgi:hypothetical protein